MERFGTLALALIVSLCVMVANAHAQDGNANGSSGDDPPAVLADPTAPNSQDLITMNFQNVDLPVLAKFISQITGKNFVLDDSVRGKVSIISPTKVTPEQAYRIFQSVLQLKGFTTVRVGSIIKIIPSRDVRQSAVLTESQQPAISQGDQYVTRMVKLRNVDATSVMSVIQPMISHNGLVAAFPQDNTLIITDDAYNVQRLLKIIGSLDVEGMRQNVAVIPLKIAFADDVAKQINKIMKVREGRQGGPQRFIRPGVGVVAPSAQGAAPSFAIVPDERTNSLIVLAGPVQMRQIKDLVKKLDVHPPNETALIHVYHLKYAPAGEMVQVLNGLLGGAGAPSTLSPQTGLNSLGRGSSLGLFNGSAFGTGFGGNSGYGGYGGGYGGATSGMTGMMGNVGAMNSPGMNRGSASTGPTTASSSKRSADFENPVSITADPATNSLVISAWPQDYQTLKRVIEELDIPRVQVFVQAIIVEVSAQRSKDIGVNLLSSGPVFGNTLGVGQLNFGQLQTALGNPLGLTGLGIGLASGSTCTIPTTIASSVVSTVTSATSTAGTMTVPCDVALMTALENDTHTNVLSAPTLLTADNEEASIVVGQNLPFVGSAAGNAALPGQIFNSVDRQNVGITLDIIPQVSQGNYVKLDLYEEVSNVIQNTVNNPLGPTTTIRSASTTVMVRNNRTAVIGGLLSSETDNGRQGVPFLSDIPVLGNLFSDNSTQTTKENLLVFLTPHIIRTGQDLQALALDERQKFVRALGRREVNSMPNGQFEQLYQPSFNRPVSPMQDLERYQQRPSTSSYAPMPGGNAPGAPMPWTPPPTSSAPSYGPTSSNSTAPAGPSASANPPGAPRYLPPVPSSGTAPSGSAMATNPAGASGGTAP